MNPYRREMRAHHLRVAREAMDPQKAALHRRLAASVRQTTRLRPEPWSWERFIRIWKDRNTPAS